MAEYTKWKPVVNMDAVNQARRQRAVFGREPRADDPEISDAYMITRPVPKTRMDLPQNTPTPVAVGIAKLQDPDPTNMPVSPEEVRRAQDGISGLTGIQANPDLGFNDKLFQQDLQDKRAWTASTTGAAPVAGGPNWTGYSGSTPVSTPAIRLAPQAPVIATKAGQAMLERGVVPGIGLMLAPNNNIASQSAEDAELAAYAAGKRVSPGPALPSENRELRDKGLAPDPVPKVATPDSVQSASATPNFIARATDVLPRAQSAGAAPGYSPSEEQIAQARRDARISDANYTPLSERMASLNAGIEAMRDLGRVKANIADGFAPDADRSQRDPVVMIDNPSWDEAVKDYAAGRVGSVGYRMVDNLRMEQESAAEEAAQQSRGRRARRGGGIEVPSDPKQSRDLGQADAIAALQYNRALQNDQRQAEQDQVENAIRIAQLGQQGEIARLADARAQTTEARAAAAAQRKQFAEDAKVEISSLPQALAWAAPLAERFYSEADKKFGSAAEATQALGAVTGAYANNQEKEFKFGNLEYSNADAVKMAQGTYEWPTSFGIPIMKESDRQKLQDAAREYLMRRALEVSRGR